MNETPTQTVLILFLAFLTIAAIDFGFCNGNQDMVCIDREKQALLSFKKDLKDPSNRLSSWKVEDDCCKWAGVSCHNLTGHVLALHLRNPTFNFSKSLGGEINPSLLNLKNLNYLDLSGNHFGGIPIPSFIGSMVSLQHLDLSEAGFNGTIPHQLGNLSSLRFLSLKYDQMDVDNLQWVLGLSYLEILDLSGGNLTNAPNWLEVINKLPSLVELHLSFCQLTHIPQQFGGNFTSLAVLDLSGNYFDSMIPNWIFSLSSLVSLDLGSSRLQCPFPMVVPNMTSFRHLDLSWNNLNCTIPGWLYSLSRLETLDLYYNGLEGGISDQIGNLTSVKALGLSSNNLEGKLPKTIGNLRSLESLYISYNKLYGSLPNEIGNLASLNDLRLSANEFEGMLPRSLGNLCSLTFLDMSSNKFSGEMLFSSSKCTAYALETMFLNDNQLSSQLPDQLGQFTSMQMLDLHNNSLYGPIPVTLGRLTSINFISLVGNQLNGTLPESFGHLSNLQFLDVSNNLLEGIVSEVHFTNLTSLGSFHASGNKLTLKVSPDWIPPFQLQSLDLASWNLGPKFPTWVQSQKALWYLDLSSTGISEEIPNWFWNLTSSAIYRDLSHNQIHGEIPYIDSLTDLSGLYLNSNKLKGSLPLLLSSNLWELDLSHNSFSGGIYHFLCYWKEAPGVIVLRLGHNLLSGEIPDCWIGWESLEVIDMVNNNLTGEIPSSIGLLRYLSSLHLRNNYLSGGIPSALQNCSYLNLVDLNGNEFNGSIPKWIGEKLSFLRIFSIRSNKLEGVIPPELCRLSSLHVLDIADNNLSGPIPRCINNFTSMAMELDSSYQVFYGASYQGTTVEFIDSSLLVTKGGTYEYDKILGLVALMDLSNNNISGNIPEEITSLLGLISLNLSGNHLSGVIPRKIGNMRLLGSIDLSRNQLYGEILPSMSGMSFLSYLNLSCNNLSGSIPSSTQLQSFDASSFIGNKLCGPPLTKNCSFGMETPSEGNERDSEGVGSEVDWFYLCMAIGFAVGFWCVNFPIFFSKSWRHAYFQFLEKVWTRIVLLYRRKCN